MPSRRDPRPGAPPRRGHPRPSSSRTSPARTVTARPAVAREGTTRPKGARNLTGRAAVVLLVIGALVVSYAQSLRVWFDQHQQITSLRKEIEDSERRVGQLEDEIARWEDDDYVRARARQRFGWVLPGEVGYRVVDENGEPVGQPPASSSAPGSGDRSTWYSKLWGTVEVSGTEQPRRTQPQPTTPPTTPSPKRLLTPTPAR
jgi:cell division protein FtsB